MELVQELFVTAVLAVLFSFVVAKLVSVAMAGDAAAAADSRSGSGESAGLDRGSAAEEVKFEDRLTARGFEGESGVEFVEEAVEHVRRIEAEVFPLQEEEEEVEVQEMAGGDVEFETDRHELHEEREESPEKSPEAAESLEKSPEEEKPGQCCVDEVKEGDGESIEGNSVELAPDRAHIAESEEAKDLKCGTEEVDEEISNGDSDDDWEGIESTELQKDFAVAAKFAGSGETDHCLETVGSNVKMQMYGLHKVATEGPCHEPQPMALKVSARAKWNAWQRLGNMSPDVAMEQYLNLLSENVPGWKEEKCADAAKSDFTSHCIDLGTISYEHPKLEDDRNPAAIAGSDVTEHMDKNSENQAKE